MSFNSLQTGRCIQRHRWLIFWKDIGADVSIPFKREGVSKAAVIDDLLLSTSDGFNSLQTGRCIQSDGEQYTVQYNGKKFQFPSNGKVYPKGACLGSSPGQKGQRFNSLQTGRCIQSQTQRPKIRIIVSIPFKREGVSKVWWLPKPQQHLVSFNSLQTGRCIQRDPILSPVGPWLQKPKTKHEVHTPIFMSKFSPKIPQTHVAIEPNTIFYQKRLGTQTPRAFLGILRGIGIRLPNRVCCVCVDILSIP